MLWNIQRSIREWDFINFKEEFLFGWSDNVFLVAILEGIIKGLLELGNGLNWAHISNMLIFFLSVWATIDEQVFLFAFFKCDGTAYLRRIGLRWSNFREYFLLINRLWLVFTDELKAVGNGFTQSLTTLALHLIYLVYYFIL